MNDHRLEAETSRRGLLAAAGTTLLGGCNVLQGIPSKNRIDLDRIPRSDMESDLDIPTLSSIPVDVGSDYLGGEQSRVTTLLTELPTPLGPRAVPNGHVRERLLHNAARATTALDEARNAKTELRALRELRHARGHARYATAGWKFRNGEIRPDDLRQAYDRTDARAGRFRDEYTYTGTDPVRTTVVYSVIERFLYRVLNGRVPVDEESPLLAVAEWGKLTERARANLANARHLDAQYSAATGEGDLTETLAGASETLRSRVQSQESTLSEESAHTENRVATDAIEDLRIGANFGGVTAGPASEIVFSTRRLTYALAVERIREQVTAGERFRPSHHSELREKRASVHEAIPTALDTSPAPELTRAILSQLPAVLREANENLDRTQGEIPVERIDHILADYVFVNSVAKSAPEATRQALEVLNTA